MNTDIITAVPFVGTSAPLLDPQPIAAALPAVELLVPQMLPPVVGDYVFDVSDRTQCPPDFVAVGALVACSTLIGNRVRILPKQFDNWTVVPNLWGAVVGPPSAMKSPALKYALSPLNKIEREWRKEWESESAQAEADAEVTKLALEEARKEAKKKLKDHDRDAAREIIAEAQEAALVIPKRKRLTVNDATVEKLGELLNQNPRGLLVVRDELPGLLAKLEDEAFQIDRAFYLEAFNGDASFKYDRIGRGTVEIEMATLSLVGGVQPARIAPIVRGAVSGSSADGLVQRLQLAVWPDLSKDWEWRDRRPDPNAERDYEAAFLRLECLNLGTTEAPALRRFTKDAQGLFIDWMTDLQREARAGAQSEALEAHLLKMPKTVASLALIFQFLSGDNEAIGDSALLHALTWADYLRSHAIRLYAAGTYAAEAGAHLILNRREALPSPFRARDVHQKGWAGLSDRDAVEAALQILVSTHNLALREVPTGAAGGRPTFEYLWHPKIAEGGR
ncbi:YfjI family protein [Xanthobacter sp. KR7-225]|uniref:YfjI family protein n=1 Tax=Xanthobacter sp. KR7-225 TaxID=3156613 RepID=UPI0032B34DB9